MAIGREEYVQLSLLVGEAFSPAAPIDEKALFAGRKDEIRRAIDASFQRGQHVIIFGERGVGKTSLSNVLSDYLEGLGKTVLAPHVNCDSTDDFPKLWHKVFSEITISRQVKRIGFGTSSEEQVTKVADDLKGKITPNDVRAVLTLLASQVMLIVILDEFDRLRKNGVKELCADTIKALSDHSVPVTLVLVGVADTVDHLLMQHQSVERSLVQIRMPRMSPEELDEILEKGLEKVGMTMTDEAKERVSLLSKGLPHYVHLLGLYSAREALYQLQKTIELRHVDSAISIALTNAQQTLQGAYHKATMSTRKESLYPSVLLACALAETDEAGCFGPVDVRGPMSYIMKKPYDTPYFARHLQDLCEASRGPVLQTIGSRHRRKFRFLNPLMQPYVIMHGLSEGKMSPDVLRHQ